LLRRYVAVGEQLKDAFGLLEVKSAPTKSRDLPTAFNKRLQNLTRRDRRPVRRVKVKMVTGE
jgi:hypothetical protein